MQLKNLAWVVFAAAAISGWSCNGGHGTRDGSTTDTATDTNQMDAGTDDRDGSADVADGGTDVADGSPDATDGSADAAADATTDAGVDAASDATADAASDGGTGAIDAGTDAAACVDGTACPGGICTRGVCIPPITINATTNLSTTAVIPGRSCAEAPAYSVASLAADAAMLSDDTPDCIAVGDEALLINLQGAPGAFTNVGNWELVTVAGVSGGTVRFAAPKTKSYGAAVNSDAGIGAGATDQKVALIRVPQFGSLIVNGDLSLTADAWDGAKGGVVVLRAATLTVRGMIDAQGLGYRGGRWSRDDDACNDSVATEAGESIAGPGEPGPASNFGGAGGLSASIGSSFNGNTPLQSGAGHARAGEMGLNGGARTVGAPGTTYGTSNGSKLTMGSGQGGNLTCEFGFPGPALVTLQERLAGGIVLLLTQTLQMEGGGEITASAKTAGRDVSASGGYVFIRGGTVALGTAQVKAIGGTGTGVNGPTEGMSVKAGDGYIAVQGISTGTTTPPASRVAP